MSREKGRRQNSCHVVLLTTRKETHVRERESKVGRRVESFISCSSFPFSLNSLTRSPLPRRKHARNEDAEVRSTARPSQAQSRTKRERQKAKAGELIHLFVAALRFSSMQVKRGEGKESLAFCDSVLPLCHHCLLGSPGKGFCSRSWHSCISSLGSISGAFFASILSFTGAGGVRAPGAEEGEPSSQKCYA